MKLLLESPDLQSITATLTVSDEEQAALLARIAQSVPAAAAIRSLRLDDGQIRVHYDAPVLGLLDIKLTLQPDEGG